MTDLEERINRIWSEAFDYSDIPESMHEKVRAQVPVSAHVRDGGLDVESFRAAVEAEIEEWERILTPRILGAGYTVARGPDGKVPMTAARQEREDDRWVDEMIELAGGQVDDEDKGEKSKCENQKKSARTLNH